jgi:GGDEF domain-containing protein
MLTLDTNARTLFLNTLDWLLAVITRYPDHFNFALIKIAYGSKNELGDAYGAPEASKQLIAMTQDLQEAFRKTDLVARDGSDFWIIFPYTPFSENIHEKILGVIQEAHHAGLNIVNREISIFTLPFNSENSNNPTLPAVDLLHFLKQHQSQYASHVFQLSATED